MKLNDILSERKITKYQLSKESGIPYTTINDICSGKSSLEKCSAETVYRISKNLGISMETLLDSYLEKRCDFELFKSNVCHKVKEQGYTAFIIETLENDEVRTLYNKEWYPESLYTLAMLDYVSRINDVPLCTSYDDIRKCRLKDTVYPMGILTMSRVLNNPDIKEEAYNNSIPEFIRFNIVENEVNNIV